VIRAASIAAVLVAGAPAAPARAQGEPASGPSVTFESGPQDPTPTNDPTPTFAFSASDPMASFECSVDGGLPDTCGSPHTTASLGDGPHRIQVRASDALQNPGEWASRDFTVDTSVPEVAFTDGPDGPTRARRPAFAFTSAPGSSFECRLDDLAVGCLAGSFAPAGDLGEGPHLLVVRATNPAGTTGPWAPRGFSVDVTGPETVLVTPPPAQGASPTPLIAFRSDESNATFECSIDGSSFSPCSSPWLPGTLAAGPHRVAVRALDGVGNPDATPAAADFTVGGGTPGRTDPLTSVRMLAERLVMNLDMTVGRIRETEVPTVLRRGAVRVEGIRSLVPGTLSVVGRSRTARGHPVVLRGSLALDATGPGTLALRLTKKGRALMRRNGSVPLVVAARFTMRGLVLSAAEKATLVRDWITPEEARRAVISTLRRSNGADAKNPTVEVGRRCGSGCLEVSAEWVSKGARWSARGRARQVSGRVSADLAEAVRQHR
jgi:hypothetical protein